MSETAADLVDCVLPDVALRQWVLTVPWVRDGVDHCRDDLGFAVRDSPAVAPVAEGDDDDAEFAGVAKAHVMRISPTKTPCRPLPPRVRNPRQPEGSVPA